MELREGYKQTEAGTIPNDWTIKKIGDFTNVTSGGTPSTSRSDYWGGEIKWMSSGELNYKRVVDVVGRITQKGLTNSATKILPKQCVLIGLAGQGKTRGTAAINYIDICTNQSIAAIHPSSVVSNEFLYHNLDNRYNELRSLSTGDSGRGGLNLTIIKNIDICMPSKHSEQVAIANVLSDTDTWIQSLTSLIAKKQNIKQGTIQTLLNPYKNGKLKDGWEAKKLGDFLNYEQPTSYLVSSTEYNDNNSIPVLTAGKTFVLGYTNEEFGVYEFDLPVIIFDDFTTASKFVDFPFKAKSSAMKILKRKNEKVNLRFIFEVLQMIDYPLGDHKRHWIGEFQYLDIFVPNDENEQTRIADILTDMDEEISILKGKLIKTKQVKQGMMQNLLTGKIRLV
ncbi:MAG: restriction endonuclease subunit S [Candidatus Thioglobus sp.]